MCWRNEGVAAEAGGANFVGCLVEGSVADKKRANKIKRRALAVSIALESAGLLALVILPMLARPAEPAIVTRMPIPPYAAPRSLPGHSIEPIGHTEHRPCFRCLAAPTHPVNPWSGKTEIINHDGPVGPDGPNIVDGAIPGGDEGLLRALDRPGGPRRPLEALGVKRIHKTSIDPALLIYRVEPVFPPILKQLQRSGRVELRAVIATDGRIQALQVLRGDALCVQSALDAVAQWRYQPTLLNGQPVEVDTFITVIYSVNQQ